MMDINPETACKFNRILPGGPAFDEFINRC